MKFINNTKNTIYVDDCDLYFPYKNGEIEIVDSDILKRSKSLRAMFINGVLDIVEHDEKEQIEKSIIYLRDKNKKEAPTIEAIDEQATVASESDVTSCTADSDIEVKIHGLFFDASGYAKVNRNLAINLHKLGYKVRIDPKNSGNNLNKDELSIIAPLQQTPISKNHIVIDSVIPSFGEMGGGKYRILYSTIESYTVPKQFIDCCQAYEEVWLTSPWSASILKKYLPNKPIYTVPAGVDEKLYKDYGAKFDFKPNIKNFVFLSVFSWGYRKGYDVLLKAYFDEFSGDDDVSLLISSRYQSGQTKFHKDRIRTDIEEIMKGFPNKNLPHVVRHSKVTPEKDMPKLYRACNAFIAVHRGEGSCLPPVEASLCGLPVIMTNCSGQQMYLRPDNAYLIDIDRLEEMQPGQMKLHYWDGQKFPSLKSPEVHNQVRQTMRHVYNNQQEAKNRNDNLQQLILNNFTWKHTASAAAERLNIIAAKLRSKS